MNYPTPSPDQVRELREQHALTQDQFAAVVLSSPRAVRYWEKEKQAGGHPMPAGLWELAQLKLVAGEGAPPPGAPA